MKLRKKVITRNYYQVEPKHDWLKYLRVVRYWVLRAHKLSYPEFEMMLFLYSEGLFSERDFEKFERIMSWSPKRLEKLIDKGWINIWRHKEKNECAMYTMSFKGKKLMDSVYKKLRGEDLISVSPAANPIFRKDAGYMDRGYQKMIKEMNEAVKKARMG